MRRFLAATEGMTDVLRIGDRICPNGAYRDTWRDESADGLWLTMSFFKALPPEIEEAALVGSSASATSCKASRSVRSNERSQTPGIGSKR
jgi:hypothetical protein